MQLNKKAETIANTLAATLALLALYQEEQDWVYRSIKSILGDREPVKQIPSRFQIQTYSLMSAPEL